MMCPLTTDEKVGMHKCIKSGCAWWVRHSIENVNATHESDFYEDMCSVKSLAISNKGE